MAILDLKCPNCKQFIIMLETINDIDSETVNVQCNSCEKKFKCNYINKIEFTLKKLN